MNANQMGNPKTEGWGYPPSARKDHFFRDGKSLCGRWLYSDWLESEPLAEKYTCKRCKRMLEKEQAGKSRLVAS